MPHKIDRFRVLSAMLMVMALAFAAGTMIDKAGLALYLPSSATAAAAATTRWPPAVFAAAGAFMLPLLLIEVIALIAVARDRERPLSSWVPLAMDMALLGCLLGGIGDVWLTMSSWHLPMQWLHWLMLREAFLTLALAYVIAWRFNEGAVRGPERRMWPLAAWVMFAMVCTPVAAATLAQSVQSYDIGSIRAASLLGLVGGFLHTVYVMRNPTRKAIGPRVLLVDMILAAPAGVIAWLAAEAWGRGFSPIDTDMRTLLIMLAGMFPPLVFEGMSRSGEGVMRKVTNWMGRADISTAKQQHETGAEHG